MPLQFETPQEDFTARWETFHWPLRLKLKQEECYKMMEDDRQLVNQEMEQQQHKERQLNRRNFVSDMQREVFIEGDADRAAAEADAEEFSLRGLPVDDDYGDADDGGALEYEDVNERDD